MSSVTVEDFDPNRHRNPMRFVDDAQFQRRSHAGALEPYRVCRLSPAFPI